MSFRGRLWLFFALIVIVPMIALAIVLFSLTASSETGKADAAVAQGMRTAFVVHNAEARQVRDDARRGAADPVLRHALVENRGAAARARIAALAGGDVEAIEIRSPSGQLLGRTGPANAVAPRAPRSSARAASRSRSCACSAREASELNARISALSGLEDDPVPSRRALDSTVSDLPARSAHGEPASRARSSHRTATTTGRASSESRSPAGRRSRWRSCSSPPRSRTESPGTGS